MEIYKLEIVDNMTITEGQGSQSSSSLDHKKGFIDELTAQSSIDGGTYESKSGTKTKLGTEKKPSFGNTQSEAYYPADWITYFHEYAWIFTDLKNFAGFIGAAWGLYEKFKPDGSDTNNATMTVFIGTKRLTVKKGDNIEALVQRIRADDTK